MFLSQSFSRAFIPVLGLALAALGAPTATAAPATPLAPLYATGGDEVAGRYMVVLKRPDEGGPQVAAEQALTGPMTVARNAGGTVRLQYTAALRGFSADLPADAVAQLRRDPAVAFVQTVRTHQIPSGSASATPNAGGSEPAAPQSVGPTAGGTQTNAPWDLDRLDQRDLPLNQTYSYPDDGAGVNVYVLDSGVRSTHVEFEGRAVGVHDSIGGGTNDCYGHGTFVSSHVAGKTYGVAKKANIKAVRILNCNGRGTTEEIVNGMDWAAANFVRPAVANMSIQTDGSTDQAMDNAAKGMIDRGLITVFIVGNFNRGDCQNSPKESRGVNMANSNRSDQRHTGSNPSSYGSCVTAFATGADVTGAYHNSDTSTISQWNGTSFAAPKAAGHIALQLQKNANLTMAQAKQDIIDTSSKDKLSNIGSGSPNRLLFIGGGGTPSPNPTVTNPGNQTTVVNTAVSLQIQASDPQGDTLTYSATGLPAGLSINSSSGLISGTPTATGTSSVTVTATDPGNNSGSASFTWTVNPVGGGCTPKQLVGNPGFENGTSPWTGDTWTINSWPNQPAHSGSRVSWILGYGYSVTETVRQSIAIPSGCRATLTFYLHIDTAETGSTIYDRFSVKVGNTTLATYSNRDAAPGYVARTFNLSAYAGQTISLIFTGTEDSSRQTSFTIDDVALNIS